MKILLVGDYPPPHGGIAIHVQQLQQYLSKVGAEVQVLDIGKGAHSGPGVLPARSKSQFLRSVAAFAARGFRIHLHTSGNNLRSWFLTAAMAATRAAGKCAPVVTFHSGLFPSFVKQTVARRVLAKMALRGYGQIIAVSKPIEDALLSLGVSSELIQVYPAFCASQVVPGAPPAKLANVLGRRSPLLVMAHHPSPVYGRELMFQALPKLVRCYPDVGLAVFGPGTQTEEFLRDARKARVEGLIEDFGELPHGEVLGLLKHAELFVRPTTADGDAISVREALASGIGCVASDVAPRPQGTTVFKAGNVEDLVERVCEALAKGPSFFPAPDAGPFLTSLYQELDRGRVAETAGEAMRA